MMKSRSRRGRKTKNLSVVFNQKKVHVISIEEGNSLATVFLQKTGYKVMGYPTILKITGKNNKYEIEECKGDRTIDNWESFMNT